MIPKMLSPNGIALLKSYERCSLIAYNDLHPNNPHYEGADGVWTIGWGHTGPDVVRGLVWTQDFADKMLLWDAEKAIDEVNRVVNVVLTQNEFDALVDFTYNVGPKALESSTLLTLLNNRQYEAAAKQLERWDHVHGVVLLGLLKRRLEEEELFNKVNGT